MIEIEKQTKGKAYSVIIDPVSDKKFHHVKKNYNLCLEVTFILINKWKKDFLRTNTEITLIYKPLTKDCRVAFAHFI